MPMHFDTSGLNQKQLPTHEIPEYNYENFAPALLPNNLQRLQQPEAPRPGDPAPAFSLLDTEGRQWNLGYCKGRPLVLLIGSGTCPMTQGSLPGLQSLYKEYFEYCPWAMLYVREAHPGEELRPHKSYEQKRDQADYFRQITRTRWPVLVDDLDGTVHKAYGLLPSSVFLIDADGIVSFVGESAHAPTLRRALNQLFQQNLRGVVAEGEDKKRHLLGPIVYGWEAIERGGHASKMDIRKNMPPLALNLWLGRKMRFVLHPIARRSKPVPMAAKVTAGAVAGAAIWGLSRLLRR